MHVNYSEQYLLYTYLITQRCYTEYKTEETCGGNMAPRCFSNPYTYARVMSSFPTYIFVALMKKNMLHCWH
jgi:hypothetical protein